MNSLRCFRYAEEYLHLLVLGSNVLCGLQRLRYERDSGNVDLIFFRSSVVLTNPDRAIQMGRVDALSDIPTADALRGRRLQPRASRQGGGVARGQRRGLGERPPRGRLRRSDGRLLAAACTLRRAVAVR